MKAYPKTSKYDQNWLSENSMGPNPLWLLEDVCEHLEMRPGMKVLDMGCGKGCSSVFLAKEFGVTVFAVCLWIDPTENLRQFEAAGVADRVYPMRAGAHTLSFAEDFFDAAVSIDSYHYYETCERYFPMQFSKFVKPGGQFGIVVPGYVREFGDGHPVLRPFICAEEFTFHSNAWWRKYWEKTGIVDIVAYYSDNNRKSELKNACNFFCLLLQLGHSAPPLKKVQFFFGVVSLYDIEDSHGVWASGYGELAWPDFTNADTQKNIVFIAMAAVKKEVRS